MSDHKWKYQLKYRLKRNKEKGNTEYFLKHLDMMTQRERNELMGMILLRVRHKDFEKLKRREPSKLRLTWSARSYRENWVVRSEIWHRLIQRKELYWLPFFAAYMDISMFTEWCQQPRIEQFREAYFKRFGIYP